MKLRVQLIIEDRLGSATTAEIAAIERNFPDDLIGLSLEEAKAMTGAAQRAMVEAQAREAVAAGSVCADCRRPLRKNGVHRIQYRTVFGRLDLESPRFDRCRCHATGRLSSSPLATRLGNHVSPELRYLEAQFAALLPYGACVGMLRAVLPLDRATSITTWKRHVIGVGERLDREAHRRFPIRSALSAFGLPTRNPLQAIGIDGGFVKAANAPSRQEGWFEVMVAKSLPRSGSGRVLAFVQRLEPNPTARMERFLAEQGAFPAQPTTFLSDGGDSVWRAHGEFRAFGDPILDWFHIAMRMTQLSQAIKGLPDVPGETTPADYINECLRSVRRAKAYLWHGSPHRALHELGNLASGIGTEADRAWEIQGKLEEFMNYISANIEAIPDYADRRRHGEPIATGFVESAVNQVVSKRLVKKQQMRWTPHGAHRLLQIRARVLNNQFRSDFERWFPQLGAASDRARIAA